MGYSYDMDGKLCCDACPVSGGVRKVKCPFGYCPAVALCAECRKKHKDKLSKAHHRERGCEEGHLRYTKSEQDLRDKLKAGKLVLKAAVGLFDGSGMVRVTFQTLDAKGVCVYRDFLMHEDVYDKRGDVGSNWTLEDFQAIGEVTPVDDGQNLITKQVVPS